MTSHTIFISCIYNSNLTYLVHKHTLITAKLDVLFLLCMCNLEYAMLSEVEPKSLKLVAHMLDFIIISIISLFFPIIQVIHNCSSDECVGFVGKKK